MKKSSTENHTICSTLEEFIAVLENEQVLNFETIGNSYLDVTYKQKPTRTTDCFTNIGIGVHIVNYAKMYMDSEIENLKKRFKSMKVYMQNCDALAFSTSNTEDVSCLQLTTGKFGFFKQELKNLKRILSFDALSTHSYQISYMDTSDEVKTCTRVCGFQLNSEVIQNILNHDLFKDLISSALKNQETSVNIPQIRNVSDENERLSKKELYYHLRNTLMKNRYVVPGTLVSLPYGFTQKMYENAQKE